MNTLAKRIMGIAMVMIMLVLPACNTSHNPSESTNQSKEVALYPFYENRKGGYLDDNGAVVIEPMFDDVNPFSEGLAVIRMGDKGIREAPSRPGDYYIDTVGKYGYIDPSGKIVIEPQFEYANDFSEGMAVVALDGDQWGFVDKSGKMVVEPQFDYAKDFSDGMAAVKKGNLFGYVDRSGNTVVEPRFVFAGDFTEGMAMVGVEVEDGNDEQIDVKYGYIDKSGKTVIEPQFDAASYFIEGYALVEKNGLWGYIDQSGKMVIEPQFDFVDWFQDGWSLVRKDDNYAFIDKSGGMVFKQVFDKASSFSEGLAMVGVGDIVYEEWEDSVSSNVFYGFVGKCGYIDKTGEFVIEPQFDDADDFSEGLAGVRVGDVRGEVGWLKKGKYGFIDKTGKFVIEPQFDDVDQFIGGVARVEKDGEWGYVNKAGKCFGF